MAGGIDACKGESILFRFFVYPDLNYLNHIILIGDSGSGLMLPVKVDEMFPFYQIGIVSYGIGCGRANIATAYTNVGHFVDWIQAKLQVKP